MAAPFNSSFETGKRYKVHTSYIWLGPLLAAVMVFAIAGINGIQGWVQLAQAVARGGIRINALIVVAVVILGLLLVYGLLVGLYALAYRNMSYAFDEREFSFYSGIITKCHVHVPYARVQSVNHKASIPQRIVGVCTITIDSAGGAQNKAVRVPYVQLDVAERIRMELFVRKAAVAANAPVVYAPSAPLPQSAPIAPQAMQGSAPIAAPAAAAAAGPTSAQPNPLDAIAGDLGELRGIWGGQIVGLEPVSYETGLTSSELALTSLSHTTPFTIALSVGIPTAFVLFSLLMSLDRVAIALSAIAVPITIGAFILCYLLGAAGVAVSYGNFKVRRRGTRIEVERGLLQRSFSGIDIERVQSIEVRQSFVRRLFGYCELSLGRVNAQSSDGSNQNSNLDARGLVVHPFVKLDKVDEILSGIAPELTGRPRVPYLKHLPKKALKRSILRNCVWYNWAFWTGLLAVIMWAFLLTDPPLGMVYSLPSNGTAHAARFPISQASVLLGIILLVCLVSTTISAVHAVLWARESGYAWSDRFVALHNNGLHTSYIAIPRTKIQSGNSRTNPFQRMKGLSTIVVTTAAGTSSTSSRLLDLPQEDADAYLTWLKPRHAE